MSEQKTELLTQSEAAEKLCICRTTLSRLDIPKTQIRRRVFYRQSELDRWLDEHTGIGEQK